MSLQPPPRAQSDWGELWRRWLGEVYRCVSVERPTIGTEAATTSGTTVDFTIPSWAKKIEVMLEGVSTNGTSAKLIQIGDAAIETTGYTASGTFLAASSQGADTYTTGFGIDDNAAANTITGVMTLNLKDVVNNTWMATGVFIEDGSGQTYQSAGVKSLSDPLQQVRLTSVSADTFDAGSVNIMYQ